MIADKQIKEMQSKVYDLERRVLSGSLGVDEYKAKCAERKAYLDAIEIVKKITVDEEDEK